MFFLIVLASRSCAIGVLAICGEYQTSNSFARFLRKARYAFCQLAYLAWVSSFAASRLALPDASEPCCTLQYIYSQTVVGKIMATEKTTTLTFRIEPNIKEALCTAADRDHRSIANMVAMMIREHCARVGIPIQEKPAAPIAEAVKPKPRKR